MYSSPWLGNYGAGYNTIQNSHNYYLGDYTTVPAEFVEIPYPGAPKIKYTLDNEWFVIKGHRPRRRENQRQNQAATIVNAPFFRGAEHSFGELRSTSVRKKNGAQAIQQVGSPMISISI